MGTGDPLAYAGKVMKVIEPSSHEARSWMKGCLVAGHAVSSAVIAVSPLDLGRFRTCISSGVTPDQLTKFDKGGVIRTPEADKWLALALYGLIQDGARCLIVEDDLASPTDPAVVRSEILSAFIGDRVVSWCDLHPGLGDLAVEGVMGVGSGYPRNAFVVTLSPAELGLTDQQQVPASFPSQVRESLLAVIVSIFDAESYLVWDRA